MVVRKEIRISRMNPVFSVTKSVVPGYDRRKHGQEGHHGGNTESEARHSGMDPGLYP